MKKLKVEELLDDEVWTWRSYKLLKFEVEEICGWRNLKLEFRASVSFFGLLVNFGGSG